MDICKKFGNNLYLYRTRKGLSQEKLAEISNLHRTYISAIERGTRSISLKNIEKLSLALNIPEWKLLYFGDQNE